MSDKQMSMGFEDAAAGRLEEFFDQPVVQHLIQIWEDHGYSADAAKRYLAKTYGGQDVRMSDEQASGPQLEG